MSIDSGGVWSVGHGARYGLMSDRSALRWGDSDVIAIVAALREHHVVQFSVLVTVIELKRASDVRTDPVIDQ